MSSAMSTLDASTLERHGLHKVTLAGLEPAIFGSEDQRLIH